MLIEIIGKNPTKALNLIYSELSGTVRFPYIMTEDPDKFSLFPSKFIYDTYNHKHLSEIIRLQELSIKKGLKNRQNVLLINDIPLNIDQMYETEWENCFMPKLSGMYVVSTIRTNIPPDRIYVTDITDKETYNYVKSYWKGIGFDTFLKKMSKKAVLQIDMNGSFSILETVNPVIDLWIPEL